VICLHFERDHAIRRRDASKKLLCTISKVPFFIDRSKPNVYHVCRMLRQLYVYILKEILRLEGEMLPKSYFVQSVKCPFYWPIETKLIRRVPHAANVICLHFERDAAIRRRDASKKLHCTFSKVPFFIDRTERNLYHECRLLRKWYVNILKEVLRLEGEMHPRRYFVQSVKCSSLLTERNETTTKCAACSERDMDTFGKRFRD
jgi:hypothetical protein